MSPVAFHLTNIALHTVASILFTRVCLCVAGLKPPFATLAGLMFSMHPIHTEAAFNIKFVGEVEKYPELYNYTLREYSKRNATEKAWNNVAKEVNISVNECKEKWRNLRSTFVKNLMPKPSGSGATKKKPYYLMEAMQFAIPFVKVAGHPTSNLPEMSQTVSDVFDTDNTEEGEQYSAEEMIDDTNVTSPPTPSPSVISRPSSSLSQEDRVDTPTSLMTTGKRGPHGLPTRRSKIVQSDAAEKAFTSYLAAKQAKLCMPFSSPPIKDERDKREEGIKSFVLSLIPDLMVLNDAQLRIFKRKALVLIDEVSDSDNVANDRSVLQPSTNPVLSPNKQVLPFNIQELIYTKDTTQFPINHSQFSLSSPNVVTGHFSEYSELEQSSPRDDSSTQTSNIFHSL